MDMRNCARCGKLFAGLPTKTICQACEKREEDDFKTVKLYIEENPNCTMDEIVKETEVSIKRINKFIREGRLQISRGMHGYLQCESCGRDIVTGKYCEACFNKMHLELMTAFRPADNRSGKMHIRKHL